MDSLNDAGLGTAQAVTDECPADLLAALAERDRQRVRASLAGIDTWTVEKLCERSMVVGAIAISGGLQTNTLRAIMLGWRESGLIEPTEAFGLVGDSLCLPLFERSKARRQLVFGDLAMLAVELTDSVPTVVDTGVSAWALRQLREVDKAAYAAVRDQLAAHPSWTADGADLDARIEVAARRHEAEQHLAGESARMARRVVLPADQGLPITLARAEQAVLDADLDLFVQGGRLVRPGRMKVKGRDGRAIEIFNIRPQCAAGIAVALDEVCDFQGLDRKGKLVSKGCSLAFATKFAARIGRSRLRPLRGTTQIPILRGDGTLVIKPGYDPETSLYLDLAGLDFSWLAPAPSRELALALVAMLKRELFAGFAFVAPLDEAAALSALMTAVLRRSMGSAPMHVFTAPAAGSGKSYLADLIATVAIGTDAPAIAQGPDDVELEKRLTGSLIDANQLILIDNCTRPLGGELLNQAMTQAFLHLRPLGKTEKVLVEVASAIMATGNNATVRGDQVRRTILCRLDTGLEQPERRVFASDPKAHALRYRSGFIATCLMIALAYQAAGSPRVAERPMAGFADYDRLVRSPLVWLGEPDPWASADALRGDDPEVSTLARVLRALHTYLGDRPFTAAELVKAGSGESFADEGSVTDLAAMREVLAEVCAERSGHGLNGKRLGWYLAKHKGRPVGGLVLRPDGKDGHSEAPRYRIDTSGSPADPSA